MRSILYLFPLILLAAFCFYSYSDIAVTTPVGPYPTEPGADAAAARADLLDVTFIASEGIYPTTFDMVAATGRELVIFLATGTDIASVSVTLDSQPDSLNRENDINYSFTAGTPAAFWYGSKTGWATSANKIRINSGTSVGANFTILPIRIPQ